MGRATGLLVLAGGMVPGCAGTPLQPPSWMVTEGAAAGLIDEALQAESADARREAVDRLSKTRFATHDAVVEAGCLIARTDPSEAVRVAAIRLVAHAGRPAVVAVLLDLLSDANSIGAGEWSRVEAVHALCYLVRNGQVEADQRQVIAATAVRLVRKDASRNVQIAAVELCGEFAQRDVLEALVDALSHYDFGVVYMAERSLMRVTGMTHDRDPGAWRTWLAETPDPFAERGRLDHALDAGGESTWWRNMAGSVKRAFTGSSS